MHPDIVTMRTSMDRRVLALKTVAECRTFAENARERGAKDLADQSLQRAIQLRAQARGATTDVEHECLEAVYAYEEILTSKRGKRQPASRTWQMIKRHGVLPAVERIVTKVAESSGYTELVKMGLKDFSFEAVVVRHPESFSQDAVSKSKERMNR